jgi:DNA-binding transcriptional regulator YiaG
MEMRAYDESYVYDAQNIMGHAVDFAVMFLRLEPDDFGDAFAVSPVSQQFANGNPKYVAGMNGCELARRVLEDTHIPFEDSEDVMYLDKSPEYWAGWSLAFYQWYTSRSFMEILSIFPISRIIEMYPAYHEMDIVRFADHMDTLIREDCLFTRLKRRRMKSGLSQSALARESEVSLRQIQLFEQRKRDINNTAAISLLRLSRTLNCRMEDLIEY